MTLSIFPNDNFAIWTHRGSPHPEHTALAFQRAWDSGIRNFEVDIRKTKDHIVVLAHDSTLKRVAGVNLIVEDLTFEELQSHPIAGERWMTLQELLLQYPSARISIDFKSDDVLDRAIEILRKIPHSGLVLGSFSGRRTHRLRSEFPHHASAATAIEILCLKFGILPRSIRERKIYAMVPRRHKGITVLTKKFLKTCQGAKIPVHVWVINDRLEMLDLARHGVSGVVTDCYDRLIDHKNS